MPNASFFSALPARRGLLIVALCLSVCAAGEEAKEEVKEKEVATLSNGQVWIQVRGNARVSRKTILGLIQTKTGDRFDREKWEGDRQRLIDTGFFASVTMGEASGIPGATVLTIDLVEHPAVHAIKIEANGVRECSLETMIDISKEAGVPLSDLGWEPGEVISDKKLELARKVVALHHVLVNKTRVEVDVQIKTRSTRRQFVCNQWETCPDTVDVVFTVRRAANPKADTAAADGMVSIPGSTVLKEAEQGK